MGDNILENLNFGFEICVLCDRFISSISGVLVDDGGM